MAGYILRRLTMMVLVIFCAVTINFFLPRAMPGDPVEQVLDQLSAGGGQTGDLQATAAAMRSRLGLDQPVWKQYLLYLRNLSRLDLGVSVANYPERVTDTIRAGLPWTIGLLGVSTLISFTLGTLLGGLLAWPGSGWGTRLAGVPVILLSAIPYFILGIVLLALFGISWPIFPVAGAYPFSYQPRFDWATAATIAWHGVLPALSIVLASLGTWAIAMRGMVVGVLGEDYIMLAARQGIVGAARVPRLWCAQRDAAAGDESRACSRAYRLGRDPGGGDLRLSGHRLPALPGDPGEGRVRHPGHRAAALGVDRGRDLPARPRLSVHRPAHPRRPHVTGFLARALREKLLLAGVALLALLALAGVLGPLIVDPHLAEIGATMPRLPPDRGHLLGTDTQGRDVLAELLLALPQTLKVGLIAGLLGLGLGGTLGLIAGYLRGGVDSVIRTAADVVMTIPAIAVLVLVATNVRTMTVALMAVIVAGLAWMYPTRAIRAQTLSLRELPYVDVARINGIGGLRIVFTELLPNLAPYFAASFVTATASAMLATVGLEALGLGPQNQLTLGMMLYWAQYYDAVLRGMWWWWVPPVAAIALIFCALLAASAGMDRLLNARVRVEA